MTAFLYFILPFIIRLSICFVCLKKWLKFTVGQHFVAFFRGHGGLEMILRVKVYSRILSFFKKDDN